MYHEEYEIVSKTYENEHRGSEQVASSFPTNDVPKLLELLENWKA